MLYSSKIILFHDFFVISFLRFFMSLKIPKAAMVTAVEKKFQNQLTRRNWEGVAKKLTENRVYLEVVNYSARWSFSFLLGTLHWLSEYFQRIREHSKVKSFLLLTQKSLLLSLNIAGSVWAVPPKNFGYRQKSQVLTYTLHIKICCNF